MGLIINHLKKRKVGVFDRDIWLSLFEEYNSVLDRGLGQADGKNEYSGW